MTTTNNNNGSIDSSSNSLSPCFADIITEMPTPQVFYESYISKRRPVVLKDCCHYVTPRLANVVSSSSSSSLKHLVTIVGHDTIVQVNEFNNSDMNNSNNNTSFSPRHSRVVDMKFGDFAEKLQEQQCKSPAECGQSQYYMTTQNLDMNEEGQPALYTSPITELIQRGHMDALRPPILGNLVPMTYNLWIGSSSISTIHGCAASSSSSSSSGLHHDYHDNLYCLLQGTKTFRLAPPRSIHDLKMKGTLHTLHDNGRIVYQEQVVDGSGGMMIRPDGALEKVERIMQVEIQKQNVEARLEALLTDKDNDVEQRKLLEQQLDALDEELLDLEMDHNNDSKAHEDSDNDDDDDDDDDDDAAGDTTDAVFGANYASDETSDDNCEPTPKRSKQLKSSSSNHDATNTTSTNDDDDDIAKDDIDDDGVPLNFVLEESDKVQFQTLELKKGDLLYLPAGWFHEVFSKGSETDNDDDKSKNGIHIAFNYWMHPPDVQDDDAPPPATTTGETTLSTTTTRLSFDKPYKSQFWQRDWDSRGAETTMHS